jgi:hypothetical protein
MNVLLVEGRTDQAQVIERFIETITSGTSPSGPVPADEAA